MDRQTDSSCLQFKDVGLNNFLTFCLAHAIPNFMETKFFDILCHACNSKFYGDQIF